MWTGGKFDIHRKGGCLKDWGKEYTSPSGAQTVIVSGAQLAEGRYLIRAFVRGSAKLCSATFWSLSLQLETYDIVDFSDTLGEERSGNICTPPQFPYMPELFPVPHTLHPVSF